MRNALAQSSLSRRIYRAITEQGMLHPGERIGVAVSGGADSVALLRMLADLRQELGIRLAVLHFNHQLRGNESDGDEHFVASLASGLGIELLSGRGDVITAARERGWNLEDAARRLRYTFFSSVVATGQVAKVAVAHTADDQAETVLARLVRGTGPSGLAAIYPVNGCVVRPLLGIRRHELRAELKLVSQPWREDSSNQDLRRMRSKLRYQILPVLERDLQPHIVAHLGRLAAMAREDEAFWTALVAERLGTLARWNTSENGGGLTDRRRGIRCADLLAPLPETPALQRNTGLALTGRLIRGIIEELLGDCRQVTAQHVKQVLQLASSGSSGQRTELPGIIAERAFDWLWFAATPAATTGKSAREPRRASLHLAPPGEPGRVAETVGRRFSSPSAFSYEVELCSRGESTVVITEIRRRFRLKVIDWTGPASENVSVLDKDLLHPPLVLRSWRPGDSFRPQGRRSARKLKHFFRLNHVHVRDRAGWPVLTSAGALVWARGMPVAAEVAPRSTTQTGVLIAEEGF